jgi:hypothetical protein
VIDFIGLESPRYLGSACQLRDWKSPRKYLKRTVLRTDPPTTSRSAPRDWSIGLSCGVRAGLACSQTFHLDSQSRNGMLLRRDDTFTGLLFADLPAFASAMTPMKQDASKLPVASAGRECQVAARLGSSQSSACAPLVGLPSQCPLIRRSAAWVFGLRPAPAVSRCLPLAASSHVALSSSRAFAARSGTRDPRCIAGRWRLDAEATTSTRPRYPSFEAGGVRQAPQGGSIHPFIHLQPLAAYSKASERRPAKVWEGVSPST